MNETKPWYLSKTIIATIIGLVAGLLANCHVGIPGVDQGTATDAILGITSGLSALVAIYGRVTASKTLTTKDLPLTTAVLLMIGVYATTIVVICCSFGCRTVNVGCTVAEVHATLGHPSACSGISVQETGAGAPVSQVSITQTASPTGDVSVPQGKEVPFDVLRGLAQGAMVPVGQAPVINSSGAVNTQSTATEKAATANPTTTKGLNGSQAIVPGG